MIKNGFQKIMMVGVFMAIVVLFLGCLKKTSVLPDINFNNYYFAAFIFDISVGSAAMDMQNELQNSLKSCGYNVISSNQINTLTDEEQSKTFIVTVGLREEGGFSYSNINITDYISGTIIVSIEDGSYGKIKAIRNGIDEMKKIIKK